MKSKLIVAACLPLGLALAGCGSKTEITTTNDSNVVLNDHQAGYASTNDGETVGNGAAMGNGMAGDTMTMGNGMAGGGMTNDAGMANDMGMTNSR